jgi:hypothetical protein
MPSGHLVDRQGRSGNSMVGSSSFISKGLQQIHTIYAQHSSNSTDRKLSQPFSCRNNSPHTFTPCPYFCHYRRLCMSMWPAERRCLWGSDVGSPALISLDQERSLLQSWPVSTMLFGQRTKFELVPCHKYHRFQWRVCCLPLSELIEQEKPGCILISCIA